MADHKKPIIIKRYKKAPHSHHGGAWKVAYADFVTAMMAFFLLLWLLSAVTEQQMQGISDYFAPLAETTSSVPSGNDGLGGGKNIGDTPLDGQASSRPLTPPAGPSGAGGDDKANDNPVEDKPLSRVNEQGAEESGAGAKPEADKQEKTPQEITEQQLQEAQATQEQKDFDAAKSSLETAIAASPEMQRYRGNLLVDNTKEGLRIQIVDQDGLPMFPAGQAQVYSHTRAMLEQIANVINQMPEKQRISISGYTDATPFPDQRYTNWELSSERALVTRRVLSQAGLPDSRVDRVVGRAEQDLLDPADPTAPQNRRISIVLLRENNPPPPAQTPAPNGAAQPSPTPAAPANEATPPPVSPSSPQTPSP